MPDQRTAACAAVTDRTPHGALGAGLALSGFGGAPIAPALSPVHRHRPQEDNGDRHEACDRNPIEVVQEKVHDRILARLGPS
jgi:hypothetical protein